MKSVIKIGFVILMLTLINAVYAFEFYGYTYNSTAGPLNNTNVTMFVYNISQAQNGPPPVVAAYSVLSNGSGYFFMNVTYADIYEMNIMYKPVTTHFDSNGRADFVGQILPNFPGFDFQSISPVNFYLKPGVSVNVSVVNTTGGPLTIEYIIKDTILGYPVAENMGTSSNTTNFTVFLPADRNYSVIVFPNEAMPQYTEINTSSYQEYQFNTSMVPKEISGYAYVNGVAGNFDSLDLLVYFLEPGNMIYTQGTIPYNVSSFFNRSDEYNNNTGFYSLTVPATNRGSDMLILFIAKNGTDYYAVYQNASMSTSDSDLQDFNITLYAMAGTEGVLTIQNEMGSDMNLSSKVVSFQLVNSTGSDLTSAEGHIEIELDYTNYGGIPFTFMTDVGSDDSGLFEIPLLYADVEAVNVYSHSYAPRAVDVAASQLSTLPVSIRLKQFNPGSIEEGDIKEGDIFFDMFKSSTQCDIPMPPLSCSLFANEANETEFNPLRVIMGGGEISFRMIQKSTNITVHYVDVDMFASGPPDAMFDDQAIETEDATNLEQAWRFGSEGPEIYTSVLVGVPYDPLNVEETAPFTVIIEKLYDDNWNTLWDVGINGTNPGATLREYADYDTNWFTGKTCSETLDMSSQSCYINKTTNMIWLHIPHFSGIGPEVNSVTLGNVTVETASSSVSCTNSCNVEINVTNSNYTFAQSLHNITINNSDTTGNVVNFTIYKYDGAYVYNGTNLTTHLNYNLTFFNGSISTIHRYNISIKKSSTLTTVWNFTYTIDSTDYVLSTTLQCQESWSCGSWSECSDSTQTRTCTDANSCGTTVSKPAVSQSCDSGDDGGGGGGSSTVATTPEVSTGVTKFMSWGQVQANQEITFNPNSVDILFKGLTFKMRYMKAFMSMSVTAHAEKPEEIPNMTNAHKYLEITTQSFTENDISGNIEITFNVQKSWVNQNSKDKASVYLYRLVNNEWQRLRTEYNKDEGDDYQYTALTPGFSFFAVAADSKPIEPEVTAEVIDKAEEQVIEAEPVAEQPPEPEPVKTPPEKKGISPIVFMLVMVVMLALAGLLYYFKQHPPEFMSKKEKPVEKEKEQEHKPVHEPEKDHPEELQTYIDNAKKEGYTKEEIAKILEETGWPPETYKKLLKGK